MSLILTLLACRIYENNIVRDGRCSVCGFVLTIGNSVDELTDTKNDEVGDKLADFGKCQEGKAEPQTEHSSEI